MIIRATTVVLAVLATSCSVATRMTRQVERDRAEALKKIDVAACSAGGGEVRYICLFGTPACITPYRDAGRACADSSECAGRCLAEAEVNDGAIATGVCERDNDPCGCFTEVLNGQAQKTLCFD